MDVTLIRADVKLINLFMYSSSTVCVQDENITKKARLMKCIFKELRRKLAFSCIVSLKIFLKSIIFSSQKSRQYKIRFPFEIFFVT